MEDRQGLAEAYKLDNGVYTAGDTLYVRSAEHLWAFGEKQPPKR